MLALDNSVKTQPSQDEVMSRLQALIDGSITREEIASWASKCLICAENENFDKKVWQILDRLSGADMISTDRPYLYGIEDFVCWLEEFLSH